MSRRQEFASDKLKRLESKEQQIRRDLGDNYYEHYHKQYQKEADFEGIMMTISFVLFLVMFLSCIK